MQNQLVGKKVVLEISHKITIVFIIISQVTKN